MTMGVQLLDAAEGIDAWAAKMREAQGLAPDAPITVHAPPALSDSDLAALRLLVGPNITVEPRLL